MYVYLLNNKLSNLVIATRGFTPLLCKVTHCAECMHMQPRALHVLYIHVCVSVVEKSIYDGRTLGSTSLWGTNFLQSTPLIAFRTASIYNIDYSPKTVHTKQKAYWTNTNKNTCFMGSVKGRLRTPRPSLISPGYLILHSKGVYVREVPQRGVLTEFRGKWKYTNNQLTARECMCLAQCHSQAFPHHPGFELLQYAETEGKVGSILSCE